MSEVLKWCGPEEAALDYLAPDKRGPVRANIFPKNIHIWDKDDNRTTLPWLEGMEFGDELRAYVVAQYKLIVGG